MRALTLGIATAAMLAVAAPAPAGTTERTQVVLVVTSGVSYEAALADPLLAGLAGHGGIGLMTSSSEVIGPIAAALTLGAGRGVDRAPPGPVPFSPVGEGIAVEYPVAVLPESAGLLGSTLASAGRVAGYLDLLAAHGTPAMLTAMDAPGHVPVAFLSEFPSLSDLPPEFFLPGAAAPIEDADLVVSPQASSVPFILEQSPADRVLVIVAVSSPSEEMRNHGDTVTPIVVAEGNPDVLAGASSDLPRGLTSDTTQREGVVSDADVAPTVLRFLGAEVPPEMVGSPIRAAGGPPTELHTRFLEWRRIVTPVGLGALFLALGSLIAGAVIAFGSWQLPGAVGRTMSVIGLASLAALVALVPLGWLPSLDAPLVMTVLIAVGVAVLGLGLWAGRISAIRAVAVVGAAGVTVVVLDALLGWPSGLTPFLGGSALDGVRFFGLGNPYAGIVLGGAVLTAAILPRAAGVWLLIVAALFAGLPFFGADLGGGVTLAFAAGLWFGMERWGRLGARALATAAVGAVVALVVLVVAHRSFPSGATHVARAVGGPDGVAGAVDVFVERLRLNLQATSATPTAWLAVLGLPVWLGFLLRPPSRLRAFLDADPPWGRATITLATAGIVGYVVNDTYGTATIAFLFLSAAVVVPLLRFSPRRPATAPTDD